MYLICFFALVKSTHSFVFMQIFTVYPKCCSTGALRFDDAIFMMKNINLKLFCFFFLLSGQQDFLSGDIELEEEKDDMTLLNAILDAPSTGNRQSCCTALSYICLTSLTRAKCGTRSTLCWTIRNISGSIELFAL